MGPKPRILHSALPKKMRRAAICSALTAKAQDSAILVTDIINFDAISTKKAQGVLTALELTGRKVMIVLPEHSAIVYKSFRNIPDITVRVAPAFSTRDIIDAETILFSGDSLKKIELMWGGAGDSIESSGAEAKS
jgi:large subunit ribosomal protein L4